MIKRASMIKVYCIIKGLGRSVIRLLIFLPSLLVLGLGIWFCSLLTCTDFFVCTMRLHLCFTYRIAMLNVTSLNV